MRSAVLPLALASTLLSAAPARAQTDDVLRRWFAFPANDITVEVLVDAPGVLRVTRGDPGTLRVAARAAGGLAEAGLAGPARERLELTAVGAERVAFVVVVPEEARVRVRLPDRAAAETLGTLDRGATYQWRAAPRRGGARPSPPGERYAPGDAATNGRAPRPAAARYLAYTAERAPATVDVRNLAGVHTLTVRWQAGGFRVLTGRPARVDPGRAEAIVLAPRGPPQDLVIVVPPDVRRFRLVMGGSPALLLAEGDAVVLCSPVVDQRLDGRRWFTFTPDDGRLDCRSPLRRGRRSRASR